MIAADAGRALAMSILVVSLAFGWFSISLLIVVVFIAGIGDLIFLTAAGPFLVGLVGRPNRVAANGCLEAADAAATLTGPALGDFIIQALGPATAIAANALSFVVSGALLVSRRRPAPVLPETSSMAAMSRFEVLAGFRILWSIPQQRVIQAVLAVLNFEAGAIVLLVVALGKEMLDLSTGNIGIILAGAGLGGLVTSILLAPRLSHRRWGPVLATLLLTMAIATAGLALAHGLISAFIANAALDGAVALAFVVAGATRQALTQDAYLGRVSASSFLVNALAATAGVFVAGALISWLGGRTALGLFGALFVVVAVYSGTTPWAREQLADLRQSADRLPIDSAERGSPSRRAAERVRQPAEAAAGGVVKGTLRRLPYDESFSASSASAPRSNVAAAQRLTFSASSASSPQMSSRTMMLSMPTHIASALTSRSNRSAPSWRRKGESASPR